MRFIYILMLITIILIPVPAICELTPQQLGQQDAQRDVPRTKWFVEGLINGCIFSWIVGGDQVTKAAKTPPEVVVDEIKGLLGKPPEYVEKYVAAYKSESVFLQTRWTEYGLRSGTGITAALVFVYLISRLE